MLSTLLTLLGCLALVLTLPLLLELFILSIAARLPRREEPDAFTTTPLRLWAIIPAHNEELLIAACVRSLLASTDPPTGILVVAHNCTDDTAARAAEAGAAVAPLTDSATGGKGAALHFGFTQAFAHGAQAVLVIDADSTVSTGLVGSVRARLAAGSAAVQCRYLVAEPDASPRARLMSLAFLGINLLRPRGRSRLGLSCGIFGNGFALTHATLEQVPYAAHSVVEDLEYHLLLLRRGLRVDFIDSATVLGEMPHASAAAATQRARWEGGRSLMRRHWTLPLLRDVLGGNLRMLEPLLDLLSLPLATAATLLILTLLVPNLAVRLFAATGLFILLLYVLVSASLAAQPGVALRALISAPGYMLWKLAMLPRTRLAARRDAAWVRTARNSQETEAPPQLIRGSMAPMSKTSLSGYGRFLLFIAGLGGLLYGIDVGVIAAALLYLGKTVSLTLPQTSAIVAAVLGGSMLSSPLAGALADWRGRKPMMVLSGVMFVGSVGLIVVSQSFATLFIGRLLQGMSGGVIAVVVPLYLAESLPADVRGRATALFQFFLTVGIASAAIIGWFYTTRAEHAIALAAGNADLIRAAQNHAWRGMFLSVIYPGLAFLLGTLALPESPRWLVRRNREADAAKALAKLGSAEQAEAELRQITTVAPEPHTTTNSSWRELLQRRYIYPFVLACVVLACNQTTGINSILAFLVVILKQAGLSVTHATQGDVVVKVLNCVMTVVAVALVDKKGRKFLLKLGTAGIILALTTAGVAFFSFESQRTDMRSAVTAAVQGNQLHQPAATFLPAANTQPMLLTVLYTYGDGTHMTTASTAAGDSVDLTPSPDQPNSRLEIQRAFLAPAGSANTGNLIAFCLALFIASFAVGPGVVVWLALSELMPMRIRSTGMGIALLINQGVSTAIAAVFLPAVGSHGYYSMFFFWAACTVVYFITAAFFLPETKGKTLEEIELSFR